MKRFIEGVLLLFLICIYVTTAVVTPDINIMGGDKNIVHGPGIITTPFVKTPIIKTPIIHSPIVTIPSVVTPSSTSPQPCDTCGIVESAVVTEAAVNAEVMNIQDEINAEGKHWKAGITSMSLLSLQERKKMLNVKMPEYSIDSLSYVSIPALANLPTTFSRQTNGSEGISWGLPTNNNIGDYTTRVKNQGSGCGSCWAFPPVAMAEMHMELYNKNPAMEPNYAEMYALGTAAGDCNGGYSHIAMQFFTDLAGRDGIVGQVNETDWPFKLTSPMTYPVKNLTGVNRIILPNVKVARMNGNIDQVRSAIYQYGSVCTPYSAYNSIYSYQSGIYEKLSNETTILGIHSIQLIGWGEDENGRDFWISKNSWGTKWGESGYFRIYADQLKAPDNTGTIWTDVAFYMQKSQVDASFTANTTSGITPLTVAFTDTSQGNPNQWKWFIDDALIATTKDLTWTFSNAGEYNIKLWAANNDSNAVTQNTTISVVNPTPTPVPVVASFTANTTSGITPLNVAFTDTSQGNPNQWKWFIDDAVIATTKDLTWTFSSAGAYNVKLWVANNDSNAVTQNTTISVVNPTPTPVPVVASFTANTTSGITPLVVAFTDTSLGNPNQWKWFIDDAVIATTKDLTWTFSSAGAYNVKLWVANNDSNAVTQNTTISVVNPTPTPVPVVASFTANTTSGITPLNVAFTDTSQGNPNQWKWFIDDTLIAITKDLTWTFSNAGAYNVKLWVANTDSNAVTQNTTISVVNPTPTPVPVVASFTANTTSGITPLTVAFTDTSQGNPNQWKWFIDDNIIATTKDLTWIFSSAGDYNVKLWVANNDSNAVSQNTSITARIQPTIKADFYVNTTRIDSTKYRMYLTDTSVGSNSIKFFIYKNDPTATGTPYASTTRVPGATAWINLLSGSWTVKEIALNTDNNISDTIIKPNVLSFVPVVASFTANATSGITPLSVAFTDTSLGNPNQWKWFIDDALIATTKDLTWTFSSAGAYNVKLWVANNDSNAVTQNTTISVVNPTPTPVPVVASFTANTTSGITPLTVAFTDTSLGNPNQWKWFIDDAVIATTKDLTWTFSSAGAYNVKLWVANNDSNAVTQNTTISIVNPTPTPVPVEASFTANTTSGITPLTVAFTDTSQGNPNQWKWFIDDNLIATTKDLTWTFSSAGAYNVKLWVANNDSNAVTQNTTISVVNPTPTPVPVEASFTANTTSGITPLSVAFTDTSLGNPNQWKWFIDDAVIATTKDLTWTFSSAGAYNVKLWVANNDSNAVSQNTSITARIQPSIKADFYVNTTRIDSTKYRMYLTDTSVGSNSIKFYIYKNDPTATGTPYASTTRVPGANAWINLLSGSWTVKEIASNTDNNISDTIIKPNVLSF